MIELEVGKTYLNGRGDKVTIVHKLPPNRAGGNAFKGSDLNEYTNRGTILLPENEYKGISPEEVGEKVSQLGLWKETTIDFDEKMFLFNPTTLIVYSMIPNSLYYKMEHKEWSVMTIDECGENKGKVGYTLLSSLRPTSKEFVLHFLIP